MNRLNSPQLVTAAGVKVDLRRMKLPHNLDTRYRALLDGAVELMAALESGDRVNVTEDWQVGHYWLRNPELTEKYGEAIRQAIDSVGEFAERSIRGRFQNMLWIGIGGSALGPQLLYDACRRAGVAIRMFFLDNTDPAGFRRVFDDLEAAGGLKNTLTVVVSKSGGTKETNNGKQATKQEYSKADLAFEQHAVAITMQNSQLHHEAEQWLGRFPLWEWVGGRTSLFSAVGLLPAAAMGLQGAQFLAGAKAMDDATRARPLDSNPALLLAAAWYHAVEVEQRVNLVVLPYCDQLCTLSKYLQQLLMESLGKDGKGITVLGNKGATDQHSYVQQLREGPANFFACFIRVVRTGDDWIVGASEPGKPWTELTAGDYLSAFQEGTARALREAGRPSFRITINELNEYSLGSLIALFERAVGYYAAMLGINAYDQPGVEAGKSAADRIIESQRRLIELLVSRKGVPMLVKEIAKSIKAEPEFVDDCLGRLAANNRLGIRLEADSPTESQRSYCCHLP